MEAVGELSLAEIAARVDFSTEQVARMCGVSRRQLAYWAQKGIIPADGKYDLGTVEKVSLIRQALDRGRTLRQAVRYVETRLNRRAEAEAAVLDLSPEGVSALCADRLRELEATLQSLQTAIEGLDDATRNRTLAKVAALRMEDALQSRCGPLPPKELALCLSWMLEHLEAILEELPKEGVAR